MKRQALVLLLLLAASVLQASSFASEQQVQDSLLQMLARFTAYMQSDFQPCLEPNSVGEQCGCFRSNHSMTSGEDGVRPNADMGMVCAFLCRYARDRVTLPQDVSWEQLEQMAMQSLVFAYSTHKANRLKVCADGRYWGSTSVKDHVWESSLWAMSVAYQAFFLWDRLSADQRRYVYQLLRAECNYELERTIPTGYEGDTKAEENGWEADVLAATLGLFPDDELASRWFSRMREFAINSYSHPADARDSTVIDPAYDGVRVCDLYQGPNLYPDYTLQNHSYFHTSYQNVVIQELGEAALALALFQQERQPTADVKWQSRSLLHHCREVCDSVLYQLALSDGELAMPNGNDWSLFLYDQITSYTTMACLERDTDALMLERRAYQMIHHRQTTTPDGSWLLRSDIGARRMGVEAHRVMMTWLMHHLWPTADLAPTPWETFRRRYARAATLPCQQIVRASTADRFTCFSWSHGLKSYTGYIAPHLPGDDASFLPGSSNLIVPFKANNTGNILGWYEVEGCRTNAVPLANPDIRLDGDAWQLCGHLLTNDSALDHRFALCSTPGNAVIYLDEVRARRDCTVSREKGGLMAISEDELTSLQRRYHLEPGLVCIDDAFAVVAPAGKKMMIDAPRNVNSVTTALLYASYDDQPRSYKKGDIVGCRYIIYYTGVTAAEARRLAAQVQNVVTPEGWRAVLVPDVHGDCFLFVARFSGSESRCDTPYGSFTLSGESAVSSALRVLPAK